jgi:ActR/RegA family two-component response regulator
MTYRELKTLAARGQIQLRFAKRSAKLVNVFQCLIVSADSERREMLERAAAEGGWKTSACGDASSALTYLSRSLVQMAVVDLERQQTNAFRPVVEQLTTRSGLLLIVCGNEGDTAEEVWVRQLGAWLYLPGVVDCGSFTSLCGEARHIAERLCKPGIPDRSATPQVAQRGRYS